MLVPLRARAASGALALALLACAAPARATPAQMVVFLNSTQKVFEDDKAPKLSLFGFFYGRPGVNVLGVYAGPRWTFFDNVLGVEFKTGAYGGGDYPARAIVNNQVDLTFKYLSLCSFSDWYPTNEVYSYLSAFAVLGPLYVGGVSDITYDWSADPFTTVQGGPSIGLGTKGLYLGVSYMFRNDHTRQGNDPSEAIRMTVGITL